jgi:dimeric dUTPase (all-alpha-NTP-PPase superfamily)
MKSLELGELYDLQAGLDATIHKDHNVDYPSTIKRRLLAFLVEVGEFANETRCFKFWSYKKASPKDVILDEYADGLHFILSLGLATGAKVLHHDFAEPEGDLTSKILEVYEEAGALNSDMSPEAYAKTFHSFLDILPYLGYTGEDAIAAYKKKLAVNYDRQAHHY